MCLKQSARNLPSCLNLLPDRQEISGPSGGPFEVTDHRSRLDRLNAIEKRLASDDDGSVGKGLRDFQ